MASYACLSHPERLLRLCLKDIQLERGEYSSSRSRRKSLVFWQRHVFIDFSRGRRKSCAAILTKFTIAVIIISNAAVFRSVDSNECQHTRQLPVGHSNMRGVWLIPSIEFNIIWSQSMRSDINNHPFIVLLSAAV